MSLYIILMLVNAWFNLSYLSKELILLEKHYHKQNENAGKHRKACSMIKLVLLYPPDQAPLTEGDR